MTQTPENDALTIVRRMLDEHSENVRYNEDDSEYSQGYGDALGAVEAMLTASAVEAVLTRVIPPGERRGCAPKVFRGGVQGCDVHGPEAGWPCRVTSPGPGGTDATG